jgi:3-oxoacyl-[acyl-carrier protein] reductase
MTAMKIDLGECRALVTGASRGIGRAVAEALLDAGARVAVHYRAEKAAAEEIIRGRSGSCVLGTDLSNSTECGDLFNRAVDALGGIDLLVNNAGIALSSSVDAPLGDWRGAWEQTMSVNLTASAVLAREAIRHARSRPGAGMRLVFMASRAAFRGDSPEFLAYAASKGGMVALARSIARGFGKEGVKSFVIAPGFTRTEMADDFIREYGMEIAMKDLALDRMTEPRDIAPLVVFLASGLADHCTGTTIDVNAASYVR